jgi:hypothetical protein
LSARSLAANIFGQLYRRLGVKRLDNITITAG